VFFAATWSSHLEKFYEHTNDIRSHLGQALSDLTSQADRSSGDGGNSALQFEQTAHVHVVLNPRQYSSRKELLRGLPVTFCTVPSVGGVLAR
jgi:hypothetical protein